MLLGPSQPRRPGDGAGPGLHAQTRPGRCLPSAHMQGHGTRPPGCRARFGVHSTCQPLPPAYVLKTPCSPGTPAPPLAPAGNREHVSGRCQLHHVRLLHPRRPHSALLPLLLLPVPASRREPGRPAQGLYALQDGGLGDPGGLRGTSTHLSPPFRVCAGAASRDHGSDPLQGGGTLQPGARPLLSELLRPVEGRPQLSFFYLLDPEAAGVRTRVRCARRLSA